MRTVALLTRPWSRCGIQRLPVDRHIRSQLVGAARTDSFCFAEIQVASPGRTPGCDTFASLPEPGGQGNTVRGFVSWNIHRAGRGCAVKTQAGVHSGSSRGSCLRGNGNQKRNEQQNSADGFFHDNHLLRIPSYTNTFEEADFGHLKIIFLQYFLRFELIQNCRIDRRWHRAYLAYCPAIRYCSFHQCFAQ